MNLHISSKLTIDWLSMIVLPLLLSVVAFTVVVLKVVLTVLVIVLFENSESTIAENESITFLTG